MDPNLVTPALAARFREICPSSTPTAVDYYVLAAHEAFAVPRNAAGNDLVNLSAFPFYSPRVSIGLTFHELHDACATITSDRRAITVFGGGDASYATAAKQDSILALYTDFAATSCAGSGR